MNDNSPVIIEGKLRKETGKNYCRRLRAKGLVPGNLLTGKETKNIELEAKWLSKAWLNGKSFDLNLEGKTQTVVIKELQVNAAKRTALHVDLMYK